MSAAFRILSAAMLACCCLSAAEFRFEYAGAEGGAAWKGLQLGVEEANVQGKFLGAAFALDGGGKAIAVFADKPGSIERIAAGAAGRPVLNLSDESDALRSRCAANVLHVIPSSKMKRDAAAQWKLKQPAAAGVSASGWHSAAVKFSARDLNKRYAKKFGEPMDERAWAGWFAARAAADTLMRNPDADAAKLLQLLKEDEFDGQKGDPHSFRANGQLRQPLMIVSSAGELLGEAPVRGVSTDLDSLGAASCE